MVELKTKIHDSFSVEFKEGFVVPEEDLKAEEAREAGRTGRKSIMHSKRLRRRNLSQFAVNTWIFIPSSLDLNSESYPKHLFWRDLKSQVRMITPVFTLNELAKADSLPVRYLSDAMGRVAEDPSDSNVEEYVYQIKMFCAIAKSATREAVQTLCSLADSLRSENELQEEQLKPFSGYVLDQAKILTLFHSLQKIVAAPEVNEKMREVYAYGDEFLGHVINLYTYRVIERMEALAPQSHACCLLKQLICDIHSHGREMGFSYPDSVRRKHNDMLVYRHGILRKFIESELLVSLEKKKDGIAAEQTLYALAAGIAMIFATIVSFSVQRRFGSLSIPLFFALIFSYMIKDRIKELSRFWFVHRLGRKYYDNKSTVSVKGLPVGMIKEGVDFIEYSKVPQEVRELRSHDALMNVGNDVLDEKVMLYRKHVSLDPLKLCKSSSYNVKGINDICRLNLTRFTNKMDNPDQTMMSLDENGALKKVDVRKYYHINIVLQICSGETTEYRRYRVEMTRDGISNIEEIA